MFSWFYKLFKKNKECLYFIHIPKTAGTSFINTMDILVNESEIFPCQLWREVNEEIVANKSQFKLLRGHFGGGCHKQLLDKEAQLLTILRHPKNLTISTYHHIKREKNSRVHDLVVKKNLSLLEFLEHPETEGKINNRMVRHLSFDLQTDPDANELFLSEQSIKVIEKWKTKDIKVTDSERLIRAKKRLDECQWFAIQEKFHQSMQLFAYTFKLPPILKMPLLNAFNPNKEVDGDTEDLIKEKNKYDLELYEYGCNVFDEKVKAMVNHLETIRQNSSESLDDLINENYLKNHSNKLVSNVDFDFSKSMLGSGWHRRELALPEKSTFRWSHDQKAYIDFWLIRQPYELSIRIINAVSEEILNTMDLKINGNSVNYKYDLNKGVVRILKTKIPEKLLKNNLLRIEFCIDKLNQHSQVFNTKDKRAIGIAVNWIKITVDE